ncbi:hypothetical protein IGA73_31175, partial [Pseudomonas aeruginosa]|nr:hypothetical protein [Pseudomonas aeruginosa]
VLAHYGVLARFEFRLYHDLKPHSYLTQYRETDLAFVMRLMEQEGLVFYFEHTADDHTLIITDCSQMLGPLAEQPQVRYHSACVKKKKRKKLFLPAPDSIISSH